MKTNEKENTVYFFVQTVDRAKGGIISEFCGCFLESEQATNMQKTAEENLHKVRISLYKIKMDLEKILVFAGENPEEFKMPEDALTLFNGEAFHNFSSFISRYPNSEDIHLIEVKHLIR